MMWPNKSLQPTRGGTLDFIEKPRVVLYCSSRVAELQSLGVMKSLAERIQSVEALLGAALPANYRSFLSQPFTQPTGLLTFPSDGSEFTVQDFLRLDDGADYLQLDSTFARVHNALPPNMVPFAVDIAGNFYCIIVAGAQNGCVVWWDHERKVGDNHVEDVAASFDDFMSSLTEFSDDDA